MRKHVHSLFTIFISLILLLALPAAVLADGSGEGMEKEANGYHVKLVFVDSARVGENQFHIQIADSLEMPVSGAEVKVSAMPVEGMDEMEMATEVPVVGVMTSNNMDGMGSVAEAPTTGVMKPNAPTVNEDAVTVSLAPAETSGEYAGAVSFEKSGEWMFNVHFTINGQPNQVEIPFSVARPLTLNYSILGTFLGINATVITSAAVLKRKTKPARK